MDFIQSLVVSGLGMAIVFFALIALAAVIVLVLRPISFVSQNASEKKNASSASKENVSPVQSDGAEDEIFAVLIAVISEEMQAPVESFQILSIKEI
jgi:sodium pump decarboxylase gamma subunit